MLNWEKPELEMIRAEWPEGTSPKVKGIFTCRTGGVSSGPWGGPEGIMGLNVGPHVGDADACVRMNRTIVGQLVPSAPKWLSQVHGAAVVHADEVEGAPEADASWTMTPVAACTVWFSRRLSTNCGPRNITTSATLMSPRSSVRSASFANSRTPRCATTRLS